MGKDNLVIGIVGGMGPCATVDLFRRLVEAFPTKKDWEKPHIIVDSRSTIPSRVRAVLYDEKKEEVIECLATSIRHLMNMGAQKIIVGCHTAHIFLPEALKRVSGSEKYVLDITRFSVNYCIDKGYKEIRLLASEGTVQTEIYTNIFANAGIRIVNPTEDELIDIREFIEVVKQNIITKESVELFNKIITKDTCPILLGCSELPVLYAYCINRGVNFDNDIIDPFQNVIDYLVNM